MDDFTIPMTDAPTHAGSVGAWWGPHPIMDMSQPLMQEGFSEWKQPEQERR